jgi:hypothetical protein
MITLFSGLLGSGKSYKMVAELSRCKEQYFVVHNIDKLQEGYLGEFGVNWIDYCKELNLDVSEFFSKEYQSEYSKAIFEKYNRPILVIVDEAHEWFDRHVKTFKMWLSYSRHLDQTVWLVAHSSKNIPAIYRSFIEVEYRAKSGSFLILPQFFFYNRVFQGERAGYTFERKKKEIFALYKSKEINTDKKAKTSYLLPVMGVLAVSGVVLFFWLPKAHSFHKVEHKSNVGVNQPISSIDNSKNNHQIINSLVGDSLEDKYAYVGIFNNRVVLEDRKSGNQLPLNRIKGNWKVLEADRDNSCTLFDGKKVYSFYNNDRHIQINSPASVSSPIFETTNSAADVRHQRTAAAE